MKHFAELRGYKGEGSRDLTLDDLLQLKDPIGRFGLTGDIPDFRLITSVPVRF